jgi:hypothetical protein
MIVDILGCLVIIGAVCVIGYAVWLLVKDEGGVPASEIKDNANE